jgi:uncharacterized integral membrane protein
VSSCTATIWCCSAEGCEPRQGETGGTGGYASDMTAPEQPGYPPNPQGGPPPGYGPDPAASSQQLPQQTPQQGSPAPKRSVSVGQILGAILFILLIIFIVENSHNVAIRIIAGPELHPPVWVVIVISAVVGAAIAALLRYRRRVSARRKQLVREHRAESR